MMTTNRMLWMFCWMWIRMQIEITIENLTDRERQCILLYYGRNMNLQESREVLN